MAYKYGATQTTARGQVLSAEAHIRALKDVETRLEDRIQYLKRVENLQRVRNRKYNRLQQLTPARTPEQVIADGNRLLKKIQREHPQPRGIGRQRMAEFLAEEDAYYASQGRGYGKVAA
ncbi:hypothetical protein D6T65_05090 [Arthrobacter frigidicola]|nr:hypothetical protein D6T65_05090 [Arthrobacter frigidicola]